MQTLDIVRKAQISTYRCSLFFEHGRSGACLPEGHGEDLCYHAHLHLLPAEIDLAQIVATDLELQIFGSWEEVTLSYREDPLPYILIQSGDHIAFARTPFSLPKRYLRTKLATFVGAPELADWVAFPSYAVVRAGRDRMGAALESMELL